MNFTQHHFKQSFKFFKFIIVTGIWTTSFLNQSQAQIQKPGTDSLSKCTPNLLLINPLATNWTNPEYWINCKFAEEDRQEEEIGIRGKILQYSLNFLGIRYRSSGKSPKVGFDCSGFTGFVFKNFGMRLKSSSPAQATEGRKVPVSQAAAGDLAFFGRKVRKGKVLVNHAAIVISKPGEPLAIIHSASNKGIMITNVEESRYWRNSLLFVRNVL